jgi:hypothetical protein
LFRQQVGTRTKKLPELDHQYTEPDGSDTEGNQDFNKHFNIGLNIVVALLACAYHAPAFAVNNPDSPE